MTATTTAAGSGALAALTTGTDNVAIGTNTLAATTTGTQNVAVGSQAGKTNAAGASSGNILIGYNVDVPSNPTSNYLNIGGAITGDMSVGPITLNTAISFKAKTQTAGDNSTNLATTAFVQSAVSGGGGGGNQGANTIIAAYELTSGTQAPSISATTWTTRQFNTQYLNNITGATLSSGSFSLPSGSYIIRAQMPVQVYSTASGGVAASRVWDNTNSIELVKGLTSFSTQYASASGDYGACGMSNIDGYFSLTGTTTVYIQDYGKHSMLQGPQYAIGITSRNEVYGLVNIIKVA